MNRDDLEARLDDLESSFGVGPTAIVVIAPTTAHDEPEEWPDDVGLDDITVRHEPADPDPIDAYEEVVVPFHRPQAYRGGVVTMSKADIAQVYAAMPEDVREAELELRIERGEPIPEVLQR